MATTKRGRKKGIGAGELAAGAAAAAAAAGAAYYFYGSKKAKQHRGEAAKWARGMKRDIVREAKRLQKLDDTVIHGIIENVAGTYRAARSVDPKELRAAVNELKSNLKFVRHEIGDAGKAAKKGVKRAARKTRKAVKKRATKRRRS